MSVIVWAFQSTPCPHKSQNKAASRQHPRHLWDRILSQWSVSLGAQVRVCQHLPQSASAQGRALFPKAPHLLSVQAPAKLGCESGFLVGRRPSGGRSPGRSGEQLESRVNSPAAEGTFFIPGWLEICWTYAEFCLRVFKGGGGTFFRDCFPLENYTFALGAASSYPYTLFFAQSAQSFAPQSFWLWGWGKTNVSVKMILDKVS